MLHRRLFLLASLGLVASIASAHELSALSSRHMHAGLSANVLIPHAHIRRPPRSERVEVTGVSVNISILEQAATTVMEISVRNPGQTRQEAEVVIPVPDGAVVRAFDFQGAASEPTAKLLPKEEARRIYDQIVRQVRDPALLEFVGYNLIRSSVFPVEPNGVQKVRLTYETLLPADGKRVDYLLPRSEALDNEIPWTIAVTIGSKTPISTVFSPSHTLEVSARTPNRYTARVASQGRTDPGPFRLSYLLQDSAVTASLFAYPDPKIGGGYFLLLAGLPARPVDYKSPAAIKREVTMVIDRSGSMNGEKIEQARQAALQVLGGLEDGEAFNLFLYNEAVESFSPAPVIKTKETAAQARAYIQGMLARGGTNIHDALVESLRQKPTPGMLPIVLFLTDGLPTIGETKEKAIRALATTANPHSRRVFTFGVGVDVNTPLLEKVASETRATATFVMPKEDVEVKVSDVFKRLSGPVLASPSLQMVANGAPAPGRVRDLIPAKLPDLFEGDQLVLMGQYVGDQPLTFKVSGNYLGAAREFEFTFGLDKSTTKNAFVSRLWANRRIAVLVDAIRQMGADSGPVVANRPVNDPRLKELVDEVVRLSTEFGVLTEYTAFLALEGTDLSKSGDNRLQAEANFQNRGWAMRSGVGAVNQSMNSNENLQVPKLKYGNDYWNEKMERVSITNVQQVSDRAFYKRGARWIDSRVAEKEVNVEPKKVIEFGSDAFWTLALKLADEGRQGTISLRGDIVMVVDGETLLVKGPTQ